MSAAPDTRLSKTALRRATKLRNSRATTLARVLRWLAAAGFSSLGELRVSFGLLLLPAAAGGALKLTILELAKGFEPPTL